MTLDLSQILSLILAAVVPMIVSAVIGVFGRVQRLEHRVEMLEAVLERRGPEITR